MRRRLRKAGFLLLAPILAGCAGGAPVAGGGTAARMEGPLRPAALPEGLPVPEIHRVVLGNGMTWLLLPRERSSTVSTVIRWRVGAVDEADGATGAAHMLEHMLFKGTGRIGVTDPVAEVPILEEIETVVDGMDAMRRRAAGRAVYVGEGAEPSGPEWEAERSRLDDLHRRARALTVRGDFTLLYERAGAQELNASTGQDSTQYFVRLPANRLEMWARMESERIRDPVLREFYTERDVVLEERRMRDETSPSGRLWMELLGAMFDVHPYRRPIIGWTSDIRLMRRRDVESFFRRHYVPSNAVGALAGGFDLDTTRALLERTFGRLPAAPRPERRIVEEPVRIGERRIEVRFPGAPSLAVAYPLPAGPHADGPALDTLASILGEGRSSRLYRRLVVQEPLVSAVDADSSLQPHAGMFTFDADPQEGIPPDRVLEVIDEEVARLCAAPPSDDEVRRVQVGAEVGLVSRLEDEMGQATFFSWAEMFADGWDYPWRYLEALRKVTPADVQGMARRHLTRDRRTVAVRLPPEREDGP